MRCDAEEVGSCMICLVAMLLILHSIIIVIVGAVVFDCDAATRYTQTVSSKETMEVS